MAGETKKTIEAWQAARWAQKLPGAAPDVMARALAGDWEHAAAMQMDQPSPEPGGAPYRWVKGDLVTEKEYTEAIYAAGHVQVRY